MNENYKHFLSYFALLLALVVVFNVVYWLSMWLWG